MKADGRLIGENKGFSGGDTEARAQRSRAGRMAEVVCDFLFNGNCDVSSYVIGMEPSAQQD